MMASSFIAPSLGVSALGVNAYRPKAYRHHFAMTAESTLPIVAQNIKALIDHEQLSVNAWSKKHKFVQSTINRIVTGKMDPTAGLLDKIAAELELAGGWQLMVKGFAPTNPPVLSLPSEAERNLYARVERDLKELAELRSRGAQGQGDQWLGSGSNAMPRRRATDRS